nr:DUF3265 domain-containing protein [Vibrio splendidus]
MAFLVCIGLAVKVACGSIGITCLTP